MARRLIQFMRTHVVVCVSGFVALATMLFVPPDSQYLTYFDVKTLVCLFCILASVGALNNVGAFERAADAFVSRICRPLPAIGALVMTTAVVSMFATNDMALIMMLPLSAASLIRGGWLHLLPVTYVLQGLAANLCGMIMPFGNPQNLYLFSYYGLSLGEFVDVMALPFGVSVALLAVSVAIAASHTGKDAPVRFEPDRKGADDVDAISVWRVASLVGLLALTILSVFNIFPFWAVLIVVVVALAFLDRTALARTDYALLLTFVFFFVFSGNMARIPAICDFLQKLMNSSGLLISAGLSQVISNVPAAVLLSHFTSDWAPLLVGVNIGGAGTLVGSLASLITLQHFMAISSLYRVSDFYRKTLSTKRFFALFSIFNFSYLAVLLAVCWLSM